MMSQREQIRAEYSDILSLADITRILKISKRKASWMLQNGYIESNNSGKKTRQYKIKIEALFEYMDKVERNDPSVQIPLGLFNTNIAKEASQKNNQKATVPYIHMNLNDDFKVWLDDEWFDVPEVLSITDVSRITGYATTTVQRWTSTRKLKFVMVEDKKLITTKVWLIDFYFTVGQKIKVKNDRHIKLLTKYYISNSIYSVDETFKQSKICRI